MLPYIAYMDPMGIVDDYRGLKKNNRITMDNPPKTCYYNL
jgi:hypothetical protein